MNREDHQRGFWEKTRTQMCDSTEPKNAHGDAIQTNAAAANRSPANCEIPTNKKNAGVELKKEGDSLYDLVRAQREHQDVKDLQER